MTWWGGVVATVGLVVAAATVRAQEIPPGDPFAYAVFAGEELRLGSRVRVYGPVGANDTLRIGRRSDTGLVASPTIELGRHTDTGPLFCVLVIRGDRPCLPVTSPVVPPGSLGVGLVVPGLENVDVPRRAHRAPLEPGAYRNLTLARGSELMLVGGDYLFDRVMLSRKAVLTCATACRVGVRRTLRLGSRASVEGVADTAATPIRFDVAGQGARTGVRFGKRASFAGLVWAPATPVVIGKKSRVATGVMGAEIRIGSRSRIGTELLPE